MASSRLLLENNVNSVKSDCAACGICSVVCPKRCIKFQFNKELGEYHTLVDDNECLDCGKCLQVCPVRNSEVPSDGIPFVGNYKKIFAAYSKDEAIRRESASGGFITAFLCYMLEKGYADAVLVSRRDGITGKSFLAKTKEDVLSAKTSIYAPIDYSQGIRELIETECKSIIVVGLPCHIQAISNLRRINKRLDEKIILTISIVCGKTPTTKAYRYIAKKNGFDIDSVYDVSNRGNGWPGYMTIKHGNGEYKVPYRSNMSMGLILSSPFLCNPGCLSCIDGVGTTADVVVCDAWNKKYTLSESDGWNFVMAKSEKGLNYLEAVEMREYIYLEDETLDDFLSANKRVIQKAKTGSRLRLPVNRTKVLNYHLSLKQHIYVWLMKHYKEHSGFISANMNGVLLYLGKILNKLKE